MTREVIGFSLILLVFAIAVLIYRSVQSKRAKQEARLPDFASHLIENELFDCLYVATVFADRPLERVWAYGLGGRGRATVGTSDDKLIIERVGERSISISKASVLELTRGGATIDRGVERRGIVQIRWQLGNEELLTSLRITANQETNYTKLSELIGA